MTLQRGVLGFASSPQPTPQRFAAALYTAMLFGGLQGLHQIGLPLAMLVGMFTMGPVAALAWGRLLTRTAH